MTDDTTTSTRSHQDRGPRPEGDDAGPAWDIAELLRKISRLPDATQWLIASFVDALNEQRDERLAYYRDRLESLEEIVEGLGDVVRTRRLVVVDPNGFERIVAESTSNYGAVSVISPRGVHVALVADEQSAEPSAEVFLSAGGNGAGRFGVIGYGEYVVNEHGHHHVDPATADYVASLQIHSDPRVSIDCSGLHFGG